MTRVAEILRDAAQPTADVEGIAVTYLPGIGWTCHLGDVRRCEEWLAYRYPDEPEAGVYGEGFQFRGGMSARL